MEMTIHAWGAKQPGGPLEPFNYQSSDLCPLDIFVKITHCGICRSDLHLLNNDWKMTHYPFVPGHEIVGTILHKGNQVHHFEIGQRVGIGWQRGSCHVCEWCRTGEENVCQNQIATCVGHHGGFADGIVIDSRFAISIPDELDSASAAPLLCGGGTTFTPLLTHLTNGISKVGVIGVGGLGHLAIQFAAAFGAEVTAFSSSEDKKAEALHFGADQFIVGETTRLTRYFDLILNTSPGEINANHLLSLLRPHGVLCQVGVAEKPLQIHASSLILGSTVLSGGHIASPLMLEKMLAFAARHDIKPMIETYPIKEVNRALQRLSLGQVKYRAVLCL